MKKHKYNSPIMLFRSMRCNNQNFVDLPIRKFVVRLVVTLLGKLVELGGGVVRLLLVKLKVQLFSLILLGILLSCYKEYVVKEQKKAFTFSGKFSTYLPPKLFIRTAFLNPGCV